MREFFSLKGVFKTRNLVVMAMLLALSVVLSQFSIYLTAQLQLVSFTFIPSTLVAGLFGPWAGIVFGFLGDTVTYFAKPVGPYFPGYAISAMISNLITAVFIYKGHFVWWRILIARMLIFLIVTLGLGYIWMSMLYGQPSAKFFSGVRIIKNLVQMPFQVIIIIFFGRLMNQLMAGKFRLRS